MIGAATKPQPGKILRAHDAGNRLRAVVRSRAAAFPDANHAPRQIALVEHHQQILGAEFVLFQQVANADPAEIHVRLRLGQDHFFPGHFPEPYQGLAFRPLDADGSAIRDFIHGEKTKIMRRPLLFRARIAKADNEPHDVWRVAVGKELLLLFRLLLLFAALCAFLAFLALDFFLALLDDFGLGRSGGNRGFDRLFFLGTQRDDVRKNRLRIGEQLELCRVDWKFTGAQALVQREAADVHLEFGGDVSRQALNFDFARDDFVDAALHLHTRRLAKGVHGNFHPHANVHRDAEEVHVEQVAGDGIHLPVLHDRRFLPAAEVHLKQGVVPGFGAENRGDLLGVHGEREHFAFSAVQRGGNFSGNAQPPRFVFAPCGAGRAFNNDLSHSFFPYWITERSDQITGISSCLLLSVLYLPLSPFIWRPKGRRLQNPRGIKPPYSNKQLADRGFLVNRTNAACEQFRDT